MKSLLSIVLLAVLSPVATQAQQAAALDVNPSGWTDLLADRSLKGWTRLPVPATVKLVETSPWVFDSAAGTLVCNGDKSGHEWLRFDREAANFIFHVEWRFTKLDGEPRYNSGLYIRNDSDGTIWHQAQIGSSSGGYLFGNSPANGTPQRFNLREQMKDQRVRPAGEWNSCEIRAEGKRLTLWVNGAVTSEFTTCEVPQGFIGLEAEGYRIEFRNLKLKELP
jgi:3-keto-disaccharide hydrolase